MYAILLGRFELAKIFWGEAKDQISSALLAVRILRSYANIFDEDSEGLNTTAE